MQRSLEKILIDRYRDRTNELPFTLNIIVRCLLNKLRKCLSVFHLDAIFYDGKYYIQVGNYAEMYNKVNYYMEQNSCFTFYCMISSKD